MAVVVRRRPHDDRNIRGAPCGRRAVTVRRARGVTLRYAPGIDALTILYGQAAPDAEVHTVELDDHRCMDYSDDGRVLSVEVMGASRGVYLYDVPRAADVAAALVDLGLPAGRG
jgi:hypothetical protein